MTPDALQYILLYKAISYMVLNKGKYFDGIKIVLEKNCSENFCVATKERREGPKSKS